MPTKQTFWQLSSRVSAAETTILFFVCVNFQKMNILASFLLPFLKMNILACEADLCRGQQHRHLLSMNLIVQGCKYLANISEQKSTNIQILNSMRKDDAYMQYLVDFFSDFF